LRLTAALSRALIDFHPQDIHRSAAIAEEVQLLSVGGPHRIPIQRKIVGKLDRSASAGRDRLYFPLAAACQSPISDPIAVGRPIGLYGIAGGEIPLGARGEFDHMQSGSQAALAGRNKRIVRSRRWTYHRETRRAEALERDSSRILAGAFHDGQAAAALGAKRDPQAVARQRRLAVIMAGEHGPAVPPPFGGEPAGAIRNKRSASLVPAPTRHRDSMLVAAPGGRAPPLRGRC